MAGVFGLKPADIYLASPLDNDAAVNAFLAEAAGFGIGITYYRKQVAPGPDGVPLKLVGKKRG